MSDGQNLFKAGDIAFGKYRVEKLLGSGAFGEVYDAVETSGLERNVALKVLLPKHNNAPTIPERFQGEAKHLKDIRERRRTNAFPDVYENDYDPEREMHFIALEKVQGAQILAKMQRYPTGMPPEDAVRYTIKILVALAEAHHAGIVHRDLKPENIMLTPADEVRILDFGVARSLNDELGKDQQRLTKTGAYLGTPNYMSPEQCTGGKEIDSRSDLFAVATMLYEMLTGKDPFGADTPMSTMYRISHEDPPLLPPSVPSHIQEAVMVGLRKDRDKRWQSAAEFIDALEKEDGDGVPEARRSPTTFDPPSAATTADPGRGASRPPPPVTELPLAPAAPGFHETKGASGTPYRHGNIPWIVAGLGVLILLGSAFLLMRKPSRRTTPNPAPVTTLTITLPDAAAPPLVAVTPQPDAPAPDATPAPAPSRDAGAEQPHRRRSRDASVEQPTQRRPRGCRDHGYSLDDGECCRPVVGGGAPDCNQRFRY